MPSDLVTVAVLDQPEQAALARNLLASVGIPSYLADDNTVGMVWHMAGAVGGIKLQVAVEDEEDARALLDKETNSGLAPTHPDTGLAPAALGSDFAVGPRKSLADQEDNDDLEDPIPTLREKNAAAAFRSGIFGLIFFPLFFFAAYLIIQVASSEERLDKPYRRQAWIAGILVGLWITAVLLFCMMPWSKPH